MSKKVSIAAKPAKKAENVDAWVANREPEPAPPPAVKVKMKRLTVDLDPELHRRMKTACARDGLHMIDEVRRMITERWPPEAK